MIGGHSMNRETRIKRLMAVCLPVFNDHQRIEGDHDLMMNAEQAGKSPFFLYWLGVWSDVGRRGELAELLRGRA